jgi:hypothetical protein
MKIDKKLFTIYLVSAIIIAAFLFMILSTLFVMEDISGQTSADLAIDRQVDQCYEELEKGD